MLFELLSGQLPLAVPQDDLEWPPTPPQPRNSPKMASQAQNSPTPPVAQLTTTKRRLSAAENTPVPKRSRTSGPVAVDNVADALHSIASSFQTSEEHSTESS